MLLSFSSSPMKTPTALRLVSALLQVATVCLVVFSCSQNALAMDINAERMALERRYTTPHSLGDNYVFDARDGWQTVNTTNLLYKYQTRSTILDDTGDDAGDDLDDIDDFDDIGDTGQA